MHIAINDCQPYRAIFFLTFFFLSFPSFKWIDWIYGHCCLMRTDQIHWSPTDFDFPFSINSAVFPQMVFSLISNGISGMWCCFLLENQNKNTTTTATKTTTEINKWNSFILPECTLAARSLAIHNLWFQFVYVVIVCSCFSCWLECMCVIVNVVIIKYDRCCRCFFEYYCLFLLFSLLLGVCCYQADASNELNANRSPSNSYEFEEWKKMWTIKCK